VARSLPSVHQHHHNKYTIYQNRDLQKSNYQPSLLPISTQQTKMQLTTYLTLPLLLTTALAQVASVQWDKLGHIRAYTQDGNGNIYEAQFDGQSWTGPGFIGATAKTGTSMSAVNDGARVSIFPFSLFQVDGDGLELEANAYGHSCVCTTKTLTEEPWSMSTNSRADGSGERAFLLSNSRPSRRRVIIA
jgi:hypothetical protein